MSKGLWYKIFVEIIWLCITALIAAIMIFPIEQEFGGRYLFYTSNIAFLFIFITFTRYIFLLKYTPFSHNKLIKVILLFLCIPLFLYMIDGFYDFQRFIDEVGFPTIASSESDYSKGMSRYTRLQYLFFATGGLITMVLLPIRMIISIWRQVNTDKV